MVLLPNHIWIIRGQLKQQFDEDEGATDSAQRGPLALAGAGFGFRVGIIDVAALSLCRLVFAVAGQ